MISSLLELILLKFDIYFSQKNRQLNKKNILYIKKMPTTKQTFHPCTEDGEMDLNHTYYNKTPSGAAKKHAGKLENKTGIVCVINVTRNTSKCLRRKIYKYRYKIIKFTRQRSQEKGFMRDGKLILPRHEVQLERIN